MFGNGHWENCLFCPNPYSLTKLRSFPKRELVQSALGPADFLSLAVAICTFMHPNPKKIRNKTASIFFLQCQSAATEMTAIKGPGWSRMVQVCIAIWSLGKPNLLSCWASATLCFVKVRQLEACWKCLALLQNLSDFIWIHTVFTTLNKFTIVLSFKKFEQSCAAHAHGDKQMFHLNSKAA